VLISLRDLLHYFGCVSRDFNGTLYRVRVCRPFVQGCPEITVIEADSISTIIQSFNVHTKGVVGNLDNPSASVTGLPKHVSNDLAHL